MVTALKKCDGVIDAKADCGKGLATVTFDPKKTSVETLVKEPLKGTKFAAAVVDDKDKPKSN